MNFILFVCDSANIKDKEGEIKYKLFNGNRRGFRTFKRFLTQGFSSDNELEKEINRSDFIVNRLVLLMYCMFINPTQQNMKLLPDEIQSLKSDITALFHLFWDFSIYNRCYPTRSIVSETFYIEQFLHWKDCCYDFDHNLKCMVYFTNGTLLHMAIARDMYYFCQTLIKYGFDIMYPNRQNTSCYEFANNKPTIQGYFDTQLIHQRLRGTSAIGATTDMKVQDVTNMDESNDIQSSTANDSSNTKFNENYQILMKQKVSSKMFLLHLGCDMTNKDEIYGSIEKHKEYILYGKKTGLYNDDLYCDFSKFKGIGNIVQTNKEAANVMKIIVETVMQLLRNKVSFSDDLLVLSFEYCRLFDDKLKQQFIQLLQETGKICLSGNSDALSNNRNVNTEAGINSSDSSITNARNYEWFKQYLQESNVWILNTDFKNIEKQPLQNEEKQDDNKEETNKVRLQHEKKRSKYDFESVASAYHDYNESLKNDGNERQVQHVLYRYIETTVNQALEIQKEYIWNNIKEIKNIESLTSIKEFGYDLRQDMRGINGIKSDYSQNDLLMLAPSIAANVSNYDIFAEYNTKIYLTNLIITSQTLNSQFQKDMQSIFSQINKGAFFQSGAVKKEARCIVKSETDYKDKPFPNTVCVCSFAYWHSY